MSAEIQELSGPEGMKKIGSIIGDIRFAMMITEAPDGSFDSRPMATQKGDFDGVLWFLTGNNSRKVGELAQNPQIALVYVDADNAKYVSLKGTASVSHDPQKIHELWNPMYQAWFPGGEQDPQIRVLRVDVAEGEFWEANESRIVRKIKYLAAAATKGSVEMGEHGKVKV